MFLEGARSKEVCNTASRDLVLLEEKTCFSLSFQELLNNDRDVEVMEMDSFDTSFHAMATRMSLMQVHASVANR